MAKLCVCDVCRARDKKLVEAPRYYRWKNRELGYTFRVDVCEAHGKEIKGRKDLAKTEAAEEWARNGYLPVGAPKPQEQATA